MGSRDDDDRMNGPVLHRYLRPVVTFIVFVVFFAGGSLSLLG